jgi:hypothetical protein
MLITDLRHFLDERGCIAPMPGPARRLAEFLTNIVATITHDMDEPVAPIRCRRRPGHKPCPGLLDAQFGDEGVIRGWEDTFWDLMFSPQEENVQR